MKKFILGAATALMVMTSAAEAAPALTFGVDRPGDAVLLKSQYVYLGHDFCWYDRAWRGPGFYWCGYAYRRGLGWGGPAGFRGWYSGPRYWREGSWVGPRGYAHREWGGWRGARDWHGGDHGRGGRHDGDRRDHRR
jgi:hypothetical protein